MNQRMPYPWADLLQEQPWRSQDMDEWDRLEKLRLYSSTRLLTGREQQEKTMHQDLEAS